MNKQKVTQKGWTLLEMMIAQSLGLALIALAWHHFSQQFHTYQSSFQDASLQEEAQYGVFIIAQSLRQAGFVAYSPFSSQNATGQTLYLAGQHSGMLDARDSASLDNNNLGQFISKTGNASVEGSDALFVRYYGSGENTADRSVEDCVGYGVPASGIEAGNADTDRGLSGFYISNNSTPPSLICLRQSSTGKGDAQSLINGVESLQFLFLIIKENQDYQWYNATQLQNSGFTFEQVQAVQIGLLIRGSAPVLYPTTQNHYQFFDGKADYNTDKGTDITVPNNKLMYPRAIAQTTVWRRNSLHNISQ